MSCSSARSSTWWASTSTTSASAARSADPRPGRHQPRRTRRASAVRGSFMRVPLAVPSADRRCVAPGVTGSLPCASMTRRLQQAVVAVLTVCAVVLGIGARADAYTLWTFSDGFETSESLWNRDGGGPQDCPVYHSCNPTHVIDDADRAYNGTKF